MDTEDPVSGDRGGYFNLQSQFAWKQTASKQTEDKNCGFVCAVCFVLNFTCHSIMSVLGE